MKREAIFSAVIIDDSTQARRLLRLMLNEIAPEASILGEAPDLAKGVQLIRNVRPDVVFLDIEMPGKSGLNILEELPRSEVNYEIIFTTAFDEFAIRAFRLSAIDYLLKPINEQQLEEAVTKIVDRISGGQQGDERFIALQENLNKDSGNAICVPTGSGFVRISLNDIVFFEADGSYVLIHTIDGKSRTVSKNLKHIEQMIGGHPRFFRVHRSYLINLGQIDEYQKSGKSRIRMKTGRTLELARDRKEVFLKILGL